MNVQLKDVTPIIKAILEERDKIPRIIDQERYIPNPQPYHDGDCMRGGIRKALRIIEQAPVVAAMPRWISVEERLPEGKVIAANFTPDTYGFGEMIIGYVDNVKAFAADWEPGLCVAENDHEILRHVSHWMPLPEPPEEESTC